MLDPNKTIQFSIKDEHEEEMRQTIVAVYEALREKGYNPISQIVGYILSHLYHHPQQRPQLNPPSGPGRAAASVS